MAQANVDPDFRALLPTLRAYYAFLKCGRQIMQEVFLWHLGRLDIPNVEDFLLRERNMTNSEYRKNFNATTRENFRQIGINKVDITGLWKMHNVVHGFFQDSRNNWSEIEIQLNKVKDGRNDIMHTLLMVTQIQDATQLNDYLNSIRDDLEATINAYDRQYGIANVQPSTRVQDLRDYVHATLEEIRVIINANLAVIIHDHDVNQAAGEDVENEAVNEDINMGNQEIGELNVTQNIVAIAKCPICGGNMENREIGELNVIQNIVAIAQGPIGVGVSNEEDLEDAVWDIIQQINTVAGRRGNLMMQNCVINKINITNNITFNKTDNVIINM